MVVCIEVLKVSFKLNYFKNYHLIAMWPINCFRLYSVCVINESTTNYYFSFWTRLSLWSCTVNHYPSHVKLPWKWLHNLLEKLEDSFKWDVISLFGHREDLKHPAQVLNNDEVFAINSTSFNCYWLFGL